MKKIQTVSSYLIWAFNIILWGYPILLTLQWALMDWAPIQTLIKTGVLRNDVLTPEGMVNLTSLAFTPLSWSIGYIAGIIGFLPYFVGLIVLKSLFQSYKEGSIFSLENAQKYKYIGWLFMLNALLITPVSDLLMILSATLSNPPGHRYITVSFGTPQIVEILCSFLIVVISWVMVESYNLKEDQTLTI